MIVSDNAVNPETAVNPSNAHEDLLSFGAGELHRLAQQPCRPATRNQRRIAIDPRRTSARRQVDAVFLGLHPRGQARLVVVR